jgi:hypothetical protein
MLDVHPPHHPTHTWRDFFIHIATITVGLLIAVGLEQTVESIHRSHQRHQLEEDLRAEAESNQKVIQRDLSMLDLEQWFVDAETTAGTATPQGGRLRILLPNPPCVPGSVGTAAIRYFAPSEAVWTAARESALVALLPVEQARMQARLAHNYELLSKQRDKVADDCEALVAMRHRFAKPAPEPDRDAWTMTPEQAERFAEKAAQTKVDIQGLLFRLRWSNVYEQGIARGESMVDINMMTVDQTRFEDPVNP